ncbi:serine/threonine protein kinase [Kitasatospora sp. NPDC056138]|uniref:serine/threonine protein kinase n=1 Tax=Kitasatospora sp. NPDC056138 TaxID=3345724 RepID=UPI0035E34BC1
MDTVLVQLPEQTERRTDDSAAAPRLLRLGPGESAGFGRGAPRGAVPIVLDEPGVSGCAGQLTAVEDYWRLSNFSRTATYVVENLEGAGECVKVAPGRLGAPVAFEFSRVILPASEAPVSFKVFAPQHAYLADELSGAPGERATGPFSLDPTSTYFLVLLALCEPRLRDPSGTVVPGVGDVLHRLRLLPSCAHLTRSAVACHIDYLATAKLRLFGSDDPCGGPLGGKRGALVAFALRFDLVREEHLPALPPWHGP